MNNTIRSIFLFRPPEFVARSRCFRSMWSRNASRIHPYYFTTLGSMTGARLNMTKIEGRVSLSKCECSCKQKFIALMLIVLTAAFIYCFSREKSLVSRIDRELSVNIIKKAKIKADRGNYNQAVKSFTKALKLQPKNASLYNSRALAYLHSNDYEKAMKDFNTAIRLDPEQAEFYYNKASVFIFRGDHQSAIACYDKAILTDPLFEKARTARSKIMEKIKDNKQAHNDLNDPEEQTEVYTWKNGKLTRPAEIKQAGSTKTVQ